MEEKVLVSSSRPYYSVHLDVGRVWRGHLGTAALLCAAGKLLNFICISYLLLFVRDPALVLFMDHHLASNSAVLSSFYVHGTKCFFIYILLLVFSEIIHSLYSTNASVCLPRFFTLRFALLMRIAP